MMLGSDLTSEEIAVLDALINAQAEAARIHARHTDELKKARKANDAQTFARAKSESDRLAARCEALQLAVKLARETFDRRAVERAQQAGRPSFSNV